MNRPILASLAMAAMTSLGSCDSASADGQASLVALQGEGAGDFSWAGPAGFDGDGRFLVLFQKGGWKAFHNGKWEPITLFNGICDMRENPAEGALLFGSSLYQWQDGQFRERAPFERGWCHSQVAIAGSGEVFEHVAGDTVGSPADIRRAKADGTWTIAFPERIDLGAPSNVLRDGKGNVWVLGNKGIARIAADGKTISKAADCSHPFFKGCAGVEVGNGVVAPNDDLYFVKLPVTLYRIRASDMQIEQVIAPPDAMPQLNNYDVASDGTIWAVYGSSNMIESEHFLFKGRAGGTFAKVAALSSNGYRVTVSNQGKVYVYEVGHVMAAGVFEVR